MKPSKSVERKRFYQLATAAQHEEGGYAIKLDGRQIKTPAGKPLSVPSHALASAIADEWNAQGETIAPQSMPLTKLANSAIDGVAARRAEVADAIVQYAATDLVCYRAAYPAELAAAQGRAWDPVLDWAKSRYNAPFHTGSGIAHIAQPAASLEALSRAVQALEPFKLAALHNMTTLTGSALISLAHIEGELSSAEAWAAAHMDENWQTSRWGEDFEAAQRMQARRAEFNSASRFFSLA